MTTSLSTTLSFVSSSVMGPFNIIHKAIDLPKKLIQTTANTVKQGTKRALFKSLALAGGLGATAQTTVGTTLRAGQTALNTGTNVVHTGANLTGKLLKGASMTTLKTLHSALNVLTFIPRSTYNSLAPDNKKRHAKGAKDIRGKNRRGIQNFDILKEAWGTNFDAWKGYSKKVKQDFDAWTQSRKWPTKSQHPVADQHAHQTT